jgi:tetratricopeptide (TPR) repeat protein
MRLFSLAATALLLCATLSAQRQKLNINAETPEGQLLQQIGQENDPSKKLQLMDSFVEKHPQHEGALWVLEQSSAGYLKAGQFDKTIAASEKLLAKDPDDVTTAYNALKASEGKKDPDLVRKWSDTTSAAARKAAAAPKPADADEAESWANAVDYAKQVDVYTEYSLYATGLQVQDPAKKIMLFEALETRNPKSEHLKLFTVPYFLALRQSNQNDKAIAVAEKAIAAGETNEDMLLVIIDSYFNKKQNPDQVVDLGTKLGDLMMAKAKPEGVSEEDWTKRKNLMGGLGYWMAGITQGNQNKFVESDATLRKALPLVEGNDALKAQALFYLGLANYKLGEPKKDRNYLSEALKFNTQCAAIKSPFQGQATKNAAVIKQQLPPAPATRKKK